jgi:protein gp37/ParB-like chromosome segregation protein Spo0J
MKETEIKTQKKTNRHSPAAAASLVAGKAPVARTRTQGPTQHHVNRTVIVSKSIAALTVHPLNAEIYGDAADQTLVDSVGENGILQPVMIDSKDQIISGHRRFDAATKAGLKQIPCTLFQSTDELDIRTALIEANHQRVKSNEQFAREAACLLRVERKKAQLRKTTANSKGDLPAISPGDPGDARDVTAKKLGIGGKKVEQSAAVVAAIDKLDKEGSKDDADKLRKELNKFSVNRAYKVALEKGWLKGVGAEETADKKDVILIEDWKRMSEGEKEKALAKGGSESHFNSQQSDGIEWAKWSWNPITGCRHDCPYCFARDIANRLFFHQFNPAFYPARLKAPDLTNVPKEAATDIGYRNVFTCSMADLFGKWVPADLIEMVLEAVRAAPQWNFLFLTKFPQRLCQFKFPDNAWVGTSVDKQARVDAAEQAFEKVEARVKWLSCEPMMERLTFTKLKLFQWVVIGGASKSTKTDEFKPPREWVQHLWVQAEKAGCKIYEKPNLLERRREYPQQQQGVQPATKPSGT